MTPIEIPATDVTETPTQPAPPEQKAYTLMRGLAMRETLIRMIGSYPEGDINTYHAQIADGLIADGLVNETELEALTITPAPERARDIEIVLHDDPRRN